jgi:4-amino-4-deoxy-L-arabinose transferase-like glycosyltransferase
MIGFLSEAATGLRAGQARILIVLLCLLVQVPGLLYLPVTDRDEARFAQASKQMVETGDYVNINLQDEPRHKKPIGIYWLQAGAVNIFGSDYKTTIAIYRLPSLLSAIATALLTFEIGAGLFSLPIGFMAAILMATCAVQIAEADLAKTDAAQCAFILLSQWALMRAITLKAIRAPMGVVIAFWVGMGGAILLKGPVGPAVLGLTMISYWAMTRDNDFFARLRPMLGLIITAAITLPWFIAIGLATDWAFFDRAIGGDLAPKLRQGGDLFHGAPPFYHLALLTAVFWPASLFVPAALTQGFRARKDPRVLWLLCWLIPNWILFEAVPNKLPHYTLPLLPALALLAAVSLTSAIPRVAKWIGAALWLIPSIGLAVLAIFAPMKFSIMGPTWINYAIAALIIALCAIVIKLVSTNRLHRALFAATVIGGVSIALILSQAAPPLSRLFLSEQLAIQVSNHDPARGRPVVVAGYSEASVPFLIGTPVKLLDHGKDAAVLMRNQPASLVFVEAREQPAFEQALSDQNVHLREIARIDGQNYSNGRLVSIGLFERDATP